MNDSNLKTDLILSYNKGLVLEINLAEGKLDEKQRSIKQLIAKNLYKNDINQFNEDISYKVIEDFIIPKLKRYARRTDVTLNIDDSVDEFIAANKFEISEVSRRGILIKEQDTTMEAQFNEFNNIVKAEVSRPLYPIQSWVSFYQTMMKRVANFSVPGAGKTSMIYGTFAYLNSSMIDEVDNIVVIGPKNSFLAWKEEFKKVFGHKKELDVIDIHDKYFSSEMLYKNISHNNLFLFNYEALNKYRKELNNIITSRTMIVFDEVHKIKRIKSERSEIAIELANKAKYRYVLTGTPIPNSYLDTWNFLHILYNQEYKDYFDFSIPELKDPDEFERKDFNKKMEPFFWRVTKHELGVPPANPDILERCIANNIEQEVISLLWKKYNREPFKLYIRLIQLASNPSLLQKRITDDIFASDEYDEEDLDDKSDYYDSVPYYSPNELALINALGESTKFKKCIELIEKLLNQDKTIVVWCIFIDTIEKLAKKIADKGYRVAVIYGAIDSQERERIILAYQNGDYDVLITNPHTLAESVSLHMVAHDAIYLEYSFNLTHMLQSRDRIHRLGLSEEQETNYYYFMLEGREGERSTIDNKIYYRLEEKKDIMLDAIESNNLVVDYTIDEKQEILDMMIEEINQ